MKFNMKAIQTLWKQTYLVPRREIDIRPNLNLSRTTTCSAPEIALILHEIILMLLSFVYSEERQYLFYHWGIQGSYFKL